MTNLETAPIDLVALFDAIMEDPSLTPMFFAMQGFTIPVLDDDTKEYAWLRILKNQH